MVDLQLDNDEGIMLESECATWIAKGETDLTSLILTNKNLYYIYEKSNGLFAKSSTEVIARPLSDIKVINGQPLVEKTKGDYGATLQIQFSDGRERFYFSERTSRTTDTWVNEIYRLISGSEAPTKQQDTIAEAKSAFSGFAAGLRKAADSAIQTASDSAKQYTESEAAAKHKESIAGAVGALSGFAASVKSAADDAVRGAVDQYHDYQEEKKTSDAEFKQMLYGSVDQSNPTERQQEFAGVILKCPNCGAPISQTTAICPDCGFQITGQAAVSSVQNFSNKLMLLESRRKSIGIGKMMGLSADPVDSQKLTLIQSFPIPNTIDDILEFMYLAVTNIDVALSKSTLSNRQQRKLGNSINPTISVPRSISDAWVSKMQQAYQKAKMSFPDNPAFESIKQMYESKMRELKLPIE